MYVVVSKANLDEFNLIYREMQQGKFSNGRFMNTTFMSLELIVYNVCSCFNQQVMGDNAL